LGVNRCRWRIISIEFFVSRFYFVFFQDKLPTSAAMPEKASAKPTEEPIEEERDDTTFETDDDVPTPEAESVKATEEPKSSEKSKFGCCEPEVFQNLQAAVGLASS
jgi:hypothetical protein